MKTKLWHKIAVISLITAFAGLMVFSVVYGLIYTIKAPTNFAIDESGSYILWDYDERVGNIGNDIVFVRRAGEQEFTEVGRHFMVFGIVSIAALELNEGKNTIRVISQYGDSVKHLNSKPAEFDITVNQIITHQNVPVNEGSIGIYNKQMYMGTNFAIYVKLPNNDFEKADTYYEHGIYSAPLYFLPQGESVIKITNVYNPANLKNGVLTTYSESEPISFNINVDESGDFVPRKTAFLLDAPEFLDSYPQTLVWDNPPWYYPRHPYLSFGESFVYISRNGQEFEQVFLPYNRRIINTIDYADLELEKGENVVRVEFFSGFVVRGGKLVAVKSPPAEKIIIVG